MRKKFSFGKEWFFEDGSLLGEPATTVWGMLPELEVYSGRTPFQRVEIFDSPEFGRVLALDGLVQLSTKHEFIYHEMLVHPALCCAPRPRKALVIGGGDGGALRELVKHPLDEILLVDIDRDVVELCRKYLPTLSRGAFKDRRVTLLHEDAFSTLSRHKQSYDVIISDSTDSYSHSKALWGKKFYELILRALRPKGIACLQTGYFKERYAAKARRLLGEIFPFSCIHRAFVGCFPFDECAFTMVSKSVNFRKIPARSLRERFRERNLQTRYYSPGIHLASMVIPVSLEYASKGGGNRLPRHKSKIMAGKIP